MIPLLLLASALAHHDSAVSQVGPQSGTGTGFEDAVSEPTLELSLGYDALVFSRTLRGADRYTSAGSATAHTVSPVVRLVLPSGTSVALRVPIGGVWAKNAAGDATSAIGPADASVALEQRYKGLFGRVGVTAPVGRYSASPALSATAVHGVDGEIRFTTYDTRASLGTGAWSVDPAVGGQLGTGRARLTAQAGAQLPLDETPDEVRWGATVSTAVGGRYELVPERLFAGLSVDARHHRPDQMVLLDDDTGLPVAQTAGARTAVGLGASAAVRVGDRARCTVRAHLPIWQHVAGVQLVETVSAGGACTVGWGLGRGED